VDRSKNIRNVAIIALVAAAVQFLPGGSGAADTFSAAIYVVFAGGLLYWASYVYRNNRVALHGLGDQRRALLYGAVLVGVVAVVARARMWQTGFGEFVWFVLLGLVAYTLVALYRFARTY
jgi:hypothetical protein